MSTYEYVYNVGLLDDLHNYFPAFLYDSGRFQTPVQVFHYFRTELHARFNLPGYGARLAGFQRTQPRNTTVIPPVSAAPTRNVTTFVENPNVLSALAGLLDLSGSFLADGSYFYMHPPLSAATAAAAAANAAFLDPVSVRPTQEVLTSNTTLLSGSQVPAGTYCAICQDAITETDSCRKLNRCSHTYHVNCIDQWFQTNINCPTCRQDIRETGVPAAAGAGAAGTGASA